MRALNFQKFCRLSAPLLLAVLLAGPVLARGNDFAVTDGMGEEIQIKNGLFGKKSKLVKDRLGNGFKQEKGIFGTTTTQASVLGNGFKKKNGILGGSDISGSTIFGDTIQTKKGIFGRRKTTVDLSGSSRLIQSFLGPKKPMGQLTPVAPSPDLAPMNATPQDPSLPTGGN